MSCRDPRSIRSFKDFVLGNVNPDPDETERWSVCLCGDAARKAGASASPPSRSISPYPAYDANNPGQSLAQLRDWARVSLPISEAQAAHLADCLYGAP